MPNNHGGRRPGAGARPGNINALKRGTRSAHYPQAQLMLDTLDILWHRRLAIRGDAPTRRARRRALLDAANWFMDAQPSYAEYTAELIHAHLGVPDRIPKQDLVIRWLEDSREVLTWRRVLLAAAHVCMEDEDLGAKVTRHLIDWVMAAPVLHPERENLVSNNQTIKQSSPPLRYAPAETHMPHRAAERSIE